MGLWPGLSPPVMEPGQNLTLISIDNVNVTLLSDNNVNVTLVSDDNINVTFLIFYSNKIIQYDLRIRFRNIK